MFSKCIKINSVFLKITFIRKLYIVTQLIKNSCWKRN